MRFGGTYCQRQEQTYANEMRDRLEKQLRRRAKELGYELVKSAEAQPKDAPPTEPAAVV